ncbi:uncharacterized protein BKA55DRAFT_535544 [Fusarium redolens]|uniref:Uncharacterized protein n=1 Tax=Fusarium redolens TaxID=48865 RepID=A0A9P9KNK7_FUSRE|nr:uncharacterized protein BKA55DRAFT_535544 [Fusarium redolens]KAH7265620.1 hypothetical protein BKA55DRAFT_535544 [Fusarium redolens]
MLDRRDVLDPRVVCKASDPNNQAFKKHQADGSAFCSTYIQSTTSTAVTPIARTTSFKSKVTTITLIGVTTVRTTTFLVTVTTTTKTDLTTVTQTSTALVTDVTTKTLTNTATNRVTNTKSVQVAVTDVEQITQRITKGVTTTVTVDVDTTVTTDVTDASTVDVLTTISATFSTFVTTNSYGRRSIVTLLVMETATIGVEDLVNPSKVLASVYAGTFAPAIRKPPASDSTLTSASARAQLLTSILGLLWLRQMLQLLGHGVEVSMATSVIKPDAVTVTSGTTTVGGS